MARPWAIFRLFVETSNVAILFQGTPHVDTYPELIYLSTFVYFCSAPNLNSGYLFNFTRASNFHPNRHGRAWIMAPHRRSLNERKQWAVKLLLSELFRDVSRISSRLIFANFIFSQFYYKFDRSRGKRWTVVSTTDVLLSSPPPIWLR